MQLGSYELVRKIGAGGMAEVWMARRSAAGGASKNFAVKRLARNLADKSDYREMFLSEARLSMLLSHSNIVQVFDASEDQGEVFLAMEWIDGIDLADLGARLRAKGERLSLIAASYILAEVLTALAYAHDLRDEDGAQVTVVHRDVSPQNVMLSVSGEVKLTDFGIARLRSEETAGTHIKGKVRYMPPEQLRGDSREPTVDLFAVGAVLHEMLDGLPFRHAAGDDARLYGMVLDGEVPDSVHADEIPPELEVVRQRLLAEDAEDRFQTAREALECLYRWPGYRNAKLEIAALVKGLRGVEAPSTGGTAVLTDPLGPAPTGPEGTALVAPAFEDPEVGRTEVLDADPAASATRRLPGHGETELLTSESPATEVLPRPEPDPAKPAKAEAGASPDRGRSPVAWIGLGLVAALGLGGYFGGSALGWFSGGDESTATPEPEPEPTPPEVVDDTRRARVLGDSFAGYAGFRDPDMQSLAKLEIEYAYDEQADAGARLAALAEGRADFALASLDRVLLERPAGKIVAVVALSTGADALILDTVHHPELQQLADLPAMLAHGDQPPVMAYAGGSPSEYFSLRLDHVLGALDRNGLKISDEFADVEAVWKALEDPDTPVALGLLWEPWVSKALAAGMRVAVSTRDFPHTLVNVLVASDAVLERDPKLVEQLVLAYYRQAIAQYRDPRRLRQQLGKETGLGGEDLSRVIANTCVLTPLGAEPWLARQSAASEGEAEAALIDASIHHTWATLSLSGRTQGKLGELGQFYDPRFVQAAAADTRELLTDSGISALGIESTCLETSAPVAGAASAELGALELPRAKLRDQPWFGPGTAAFANLDALGPLLQELELSLAELNPASVEVRVVGYGEGPGYEGRKLGERRARAFVAELEGRGVSLALRAEGREGGEGLAQRRGLELELLRRP